MSKASNILRPVPKKKSAKAKTKLTNRKHSPVVEALQYDKKVDKLVEGGSSRKDAESTISNMIERTQNPEVVKEFAEEFQGRTPLLICKDCSRVIPPGQLPVVLKWKQHDPSKPEFMGKEIAEAIHFRCDQIRKGITPAQMEEKKKVAEEKATATDPGAKKLAKLKVAKAKSAEADKADLRTIHIVVKKNPRKEGSHGWHSYGKMKEGMTIEEYLKAGGRRVDLMWDADKKNIELKEAK